MNEREAATTVRELAQLATRQAQALAEAGRPDLAERCHVVVTKDGLIRLSTNETTITGSGNAAPERLKAIAIDPLFERTPQ